MQDVNLENIKIELEDNKQLLMNNDISLIDCAININDIIKMNDSLKQEIDKRCEYFQDLYSDINFDKNIIIPLLRYTLKKRNQFEMLPFLPRVFTIDFSINDLRAENWQGYYSDGFEVPTVEDRILGRVTQEEGKLAEIYKDFLYKTEDIPKKLYLRELCYFKKLIACQKDSYRLKQLLAFNDSKSNIIKVITILITTINREISNPKNIIKNKEKKEILNTKLTLVYNKNEYFTLNGKRFLQLSESLTQTLKAILDCDTRKIKISTLRSNVHRIKDEAKKIIQNEEFEILNFNRKAKEYQLHKSVTYRNKFDK